jgi:hypothetical protein
VDIIETNGDLIRVLQVTFLSFFVDYMDLQV